MASHVGDGTFVFMDFTGKAYRCRLRDGSLVWKAGGQPGSWTDATATLGPDNVVYTQSAALKASYLDGADPVSAARYLIGIGTGYKNLLSARALEDGRLLWQSEVPLM